MTVKSLIPETAKAYEKRARAQMTSVMKAPPPECAIALTADEWRIVSSTWLLLRRGVYLPYVSRRVLKQLHSPAVRQEAEEYVRRRPYITAEAAVLITGDHESWNAYELFEESKPLLQSV